MNWRLRVCLLAPFILAFTFIALWIGPLSLKYEAPITPPEHQEEALTGSIDIVQLADHLHVPCKHKMHSDSSVLDCVRSSGFEFSETKQEGGNNMDNNFANGPSSNHDLSSSGLFLIIGGTIVLFSIGAVIFCVFSSGTLQLKDPVVRIISSNESAASSTSTLHSASSTESTSQDPSSSNYIQIIDPKKSQKLSKILNALNVTSEEVCRALQEGKGLHVVLMQNLLKMAPTVDEEYMLRRYCGDLFRLTPADRLLKVLLDIPSAYKRMELLLCMCTLQEDEKVLKQSFSVLEAACMELRGSKLLFKLCEDVLKTGQDGAQAFKLDTLLKLSDVKGADGKTTLLHFLVQETACFEGAQAALAAPEKPSALFVTLEGYHRNIGLQLMSDLSGQLENVKRAAVLDLNALTGTVSKLAGELVQARTFLDTQMTKADEKDAFYQTLRRYVVNAEVNVGCLIAEEKRIMTLMKSTGDYFHASKDDEVRIFVIFRDFLVRLDRVCRELKNAPTKLTWGPINNELNKVHPEAPYSTHSHLE